MMYWKSIEETHCTFGTRSSKKLGSLTVIISCQQTESETPSSALSSIQQDEKENANPKKVREYKYYSMNLVLF